jgi:hypothetical protein
MSEITEFEQLMPLLDQTDLSEVNVHLDNKLALDISDFVKSKGIHHDMVVFEIWQNQLHILSW